MFCDNFINLTIEITPTFHMNILRIVIGLLYLIMMNVTVIWIYIQKKNALNGSNNLAVESVIFPLFINIMWILAFSDCYIGLLIIFLPINVNDNNSNVTLIQLILYPIGYIIQHAVIEGIAFLLLQKGCGRYGSLKAGQYTLVWSLFTTIIMYIRFAQIPILSNLLYLIWCFLLIIFYLLIWILPSKYLYRRSAVLPYAKFWCIYRLIMFIFLVIISFRSITSKSIELIGSCGYDFVYLLFYPLIHPLVLYRTLLNDSRWWQGIAFHLNDSTTNGQQKGTMRAPLLGVDISQQSAQLLARVIDNMGGKQSANLLNFAEIHLDKNKLLGHGSFSKVYRGTYRSTPCAIKLIFTADLTEDVILRAEAEATLLSSVKSPNIVNILGVSVLPPSVCLVLELCAYGSLSDVIRGDSGALSKYPLSLSLLDRLYLALGCARGVAALHSLGKDVVHRDIKSYNFLVDGQLNAKLADLELGTDSRIEQEEDESPFQKDFLANWMPPEVLRGQSYTQASDIYSLTLVLWEIISGKVPFLDVPSPPPPPSAPLLTSITKNFSFQSIASSLTGYDTGSAHHGHGHSRQSIDSKKVPNRISTRNQVLSGYRPEIPPCPPDYAEIIRMGWSADHYHRPSAHDLVVQLENLLRKYLPANMMLIEESSDIYQLVDEFLLSGKGREYFTEIMNFRCQVEDSTQRFSQTLSIFTHSSKQLPSLSHPNFRMEQRPMLLSPVRTHIDDTRSSSIGLLISNPLSPLRPEDMNVSNDGTNDEQKNFIEEPISSLYLRVHDSIVWTIVNGLSEPALILTGQPPYFILKGSLHWHDLMGYTPEAIFGKCLEHFIPSDYWFKNPYLSQIQKPFSSSSQEPDLNIISELNEDDLSTYDALMTFYRQLQFCSNAVYHHHIVLSLKAADDKILPFSLHALPIFKRQERRFGSDSVSGISAQLKSLVESGGDLPRNEVLPDDYIRSNTVAYYVVYMNHLTYLHPDHPDDVDQDRASSFVDRVLSVASSTISGGIGKSLFGPNAEKSNNIQNQYPSPPNIESESEDETWGRYSL